MDWEGLQRPALLSRLITEEFQAVAEFFDLPFFSVARIYTD